MRRIVTQVSTATIVPVVVRSLRISQSQGSPDYLQPGGPLFQGQSNRKLFWSIGDWTRISPTGNTPMLLQQEKILRCHVWLVLSPRKKEVVRMPVLSLQHLMWADMVWADNTSILANTSVHLKPGDTPPPRLQTLSIWYYTTTWNMQ